MANRAGPGPTRGYHGPIRVFARPSGATKNIYGHLAGASPRLWPDFVEDYLGDALVTPGNLYDASAVGSPTLAVKKDVADGVLEATLASQSEAELIGYDWGDYTSIPMNKEPKYLFAVNVAVLPSTNERMVFGLADAIDGTLNDIVRNAWFRLEASGVVVLEADDGTTDTDDQATSPSFTVVAGTRHYFELHITQEGFVRFWIDGGYVGQIAVAAMDSTRMQPVAYNQKDSGSGVPSFELDLIHGFWDRS